MQHASFDVASVPIPTAAGHVVAGALVVLLVPVLLTATPSLFGADRAVVAGAGADGMQPAVDSHHVVFVQEVKPGAITRGDIVAFDRGGTRSYRRVALVTSRDGQPAFIVQAEAKTRPADEPVPAAAVRGRVVSTMPFVGAVIGAARSAPVLGIVLLSGPGLAVYELLAAVVLLGVVGLETRWLSGRVTESLAAGSGDGLRLTRADLTATTAALGALAAFAVGVFINAASPLTLTLAILAVGLFGYAAFLWKTTPPARQGREPVDVVAGDLARSADGRAQVRVSQPDDLVGMAVAADRPLAVDQAAGACFLPDGEVVYIADGLPQDIGENGASATDEAAGNDTAGDPDDGSPSADPLAPPGPDISADRSDTQAAHQRDMENPVEQPEDAAPADDLPSTESAPADASGAAGQDDEGIPPAGEVEAETGEATESESTATADSGTESVTLSEQLGLPEGTIAGVGVAVAAVVALLAGRVLVGRLVGDAVSPLTAVGVGGGLVGGAGMALLRSVMDLRPTQPAADILGRAGIDDDGDWPARPAAALYVLFVALVGAVFPRLAWVAVGSGTTTLAGVGVGVAVGLLLGIAGLVAAGLEVLDLDPESPGPWVFLASYLLFGAVLGLAMLAGGGLVA